MPDVNLNEFHAKFPGGVRWRVGMQGLEIEGLGLVLPGAAVQQRAKHYTDLYAPLFGKVSNDKRVPFELLAACALTEGAPIHPETSIREEPGYISDEETPSRISAGFCQLLISTARSVMHNPKIDRAWLINPTNSLEACASYLLQLKPITGFDPVYAACAYNAGGLYQEALPGNRWRLRQYPRGTGAHANRFTENFNAVMSLTTNGLPNIDYFPYRQLLIEPAAILAKDEKPS